MFCRISEKTFSDLPKKCGTKYNVKGILRLGNFPHKTTFGMGEGIYLDACEVTSTGGKYRKSGEGEDPEVLLQ